MPIFLGLLAYIAAVVALFSTGAAMLSSMSEPSTSKVSARSQAPSLASPRIQAWLERKAEGVAFAEKEKAAAQAERERANELRAKLAATPAPYAAPAPRAHEAEERTPPRVREVDERRHAERERAARAKEQARREARRRLRDIEAHAVYSFAPESRRSWPSYADDVLTRRDRYGY